MQAVVGAVFVERRRRADATRHIGEGKKKRGKRILERQPDGACVNDRDRVQCGDFATAYGIGFRIADAIDVVFDGRCVEIGTVVELDSAAQFEDEGLVVGAFPGFDEPWRQQSLAIDRQQRVVNSSTSGTSLEVAGEVRIERQWIGENRRRQSTAACRATLGKTCRSAEQAAGDTGD
jgi:hypothetical protein